MISRGSLDRAPTRRAGYWVQKSAAALVTALLGYWLYLVIYAVEFVKSDAVELYLLLFL